MIEFRPVQLSDRELIERYQSITPRDGLNYLFEVLYLYRNACEFEIAEWEGFLLIKTFVRCNHNFLYPLGKGDIQKAFIQMLEYSERHKCPFALYQIREEELESLRPLLPTFLKVEPTPQEEEYIYERERLSTLQGKALQPKRNHINALLKECDCRFEPFDLNNIEEAKAFEREWCEKHFDPEDQKTQMEVEAIQEAFAHYEVLGLKGGVIRVHGVVQGFSIGTKMTENTFIVLFEKANHEIRGAYPFLNREFVNCFCSDCQFVNREEDGGEEGLRKAKLSYQPLPMRKLYSIVR